MKQQQARVPVGMISRDPNQPRKGRSAAKQAELTDSIARYGQLVPGIGFQHEGKVFLIEGEGRLNALLALKRPDMMMVLLPEPPSMAQLRIIQASVDVHRVSLNQMERSNLLAEIQKETNWSVTELAEQLSMDQPPCSKLLACQKLASEVQGLLSTGAIDLERAYILSQIEDHASQVALVKEFAQLSREALRAKVKSQGKPAAKTKRAVFALGGGASLTFKGDDVTLDELIEQLAETLKRLRKGLADGLDAVTVQRVFKNKAK